MTKYYRLEGHFGHSTKSFKRQTQLVCTVKSKAEALQ